MGESSFSKNREGVYVKLISKRYAKNCHLKLIPN